VKITHSRAQIPQYAVESAAGVSRTPATCPRTPGFGSTTRADGPHNLASNPTSCPVPAPRKDAA
jgi:hypothetical protein